MSKTVSSEVELKMSVHASHSISPYVLVTFCVHHGVKNCRNHIQNECEDFIIIDIYL